MAETIYENEMQFFPFDSEYLGVDEDGRPLFDRAQDSAFLRKVFAQYFSDGVFVNTNGNSFQVLANSGNTITIKSGASNNRGLFTILENDTTIDLPSPPASANVTRIDRIVKRADINRASRYDKFVVITGEETTGTPSAPNITRNDSINDLCLASILRRGAAVSIVQSDITDERMNDEVCGIVVSTMQTLDTESFYEQVRADMSEFKQEEQAKFSQWFELLQVTLDGDVAGNLYNLILARALKSSNVETTLLASNWQGTQAPFTYNLAVEGITSTSNQEILLSTNVTLEQVEIAQSANILDGGQSNGVMTLKAWGDKPSIDIPVKIILRGDA